MYGCRPRSSLLASLPSAGGCSSPILVPVPQPHTCPPGSRSPPSSTGCHPALPSPPASCKPASASQPTLTHVHPMGKLFQGSAPVPFPFPQAVGEAVLWGWQRQGAAAGLARPLVPGRRSPPCPAVLMLRVHPPRDRHHLHQEKQPQPSAQKPPGGSVQLHFRIYLK